MSARRSTRLPRACSGDMYLLESGSIVQKRTMYVNRHLSGENHFTLSLEYRFFAGSAAPRGVTKNRCFPSSDILRFLRHCAKSQEADFSLLMGKPRFGLLTPLSSLATPSGQEIARATRHLQQAAGFGRLAYCLPLDCPLRDHSVARLWFVVSGSVRWLAAFVERDQER
jgi:hypothetical protein